MTELNFKNRTLYHGDNLDFLRGMNSETVHLIATDPPFKKQRDFHDKKGEFSDKWSWDKDVHPDWMDSLFDDWRTVYEVIDAANHAYGQDMGAFLCFMAVRLIEMHRILRPDGSLYLHIDHTAHAWVKCLLDADSGIRILGMRSYGTVIKGGLSQRWLPVNTTQFSGIDKGDKVTFNADAVRSSLLWRFVETHLNTLLGARRASRSL